MIDDEWQGRCCVLCAARNRDTRLESGHCCPACRVRIDDQLRDVVAIGDSTAAEIPTGGRSGGRSNESKPPTDLDRLAPYLATIRLADTVHATIADVLLSWERIVREERRLAWVGNATAGHTGTAEAVLAAQSARASVATLRANLDWITAAPTFPLEDFADEITKCAHRMAAFALDTRSGDRVVTCPTVTTDGDCGQRLHVRTWLPLEAHDGTGRRDWSIGEDVTCKRCGVTRSPEQLIHAAGKDAAWLDAEAIRDWYGIPERTLRRWAANGHVRREHGRYSVADVEEYRSAPA